MVPVPSERVEQGPFSPKSPVTDMDSQTQPSTHELVLAAVNVARSAGLSWEAIAEVLGVDLETASGRYPSLSWPRGPGADA